MKKIVSLMLVLTMAVALFAGCAAKTKVEVPASALEILENIWAKYGEAEKFYIMGGNAENAVMDAPGAYDMAAAEELTYVLQVPADQLANIDGAATMMHAMNANSFTGGVMHMTKGADAKAFAAAMKDAVLNAQWMCGFPEKLVVAVVGAEYVLVAYGLNDFMTPFQTHLAAAYADAEVLYVEDIA